MSGAVRVPIALALTGASGAQYGLRLLGSAAGVFIGQCTFTILNLIFHILVIHFNGSFVQIILKISEIAWRILPSNLWFYQSGRRHPHIGRK